MESAGEYGEAVIRNLEITWHLSHKRGERERRLTSVLNSLSRTLPKGEKRGRGIKTNKEIRNDPEFQDKGRAKMFPCYLPHSTGGSHEKKEVEKRRWGKGNQGIEQIRAGFKLEKRKKGITFKTRSCPWVRTEARRPGETPERWQKTKKTQTSD